MVRKIFLIWRKFYPLPIPVTEVSQKQCFWRCLNILEVFVVGIWEGQLLVGILEVLGGPLPLYMLVQFCLIYLNPISFFPVTYILANFKH